MNARSIEMETLSESLRRLAEEGYRESFAVRYGRLVISGSDASWAPEDLEVVETVRFEGVSDPDDEAVLMVLRSKRGDGVQGTLSSGYGLHTEPGTAEVLRRLGGAQRAGGARSRTEPRDP